MGDQVVRGGEMERKTTCLMKQVEKKGRELRRRMRVTLPQKGKKRRKRQEPRP